MEKYDFLPLLWEVVYILVKHALQVIWFTNLT